jgi:large subunit ribosomal protein L6
MSRIGKLPITIPASVDLNWNGSEITTKGKFGTLEITIPDTIGIQQDENTLTVSLKNDARNFRPLHGLYRTLINNMIIGVSEQFELTLILKGVGYRAAVQGKEIVLSLGYSHEGPDEEGLGSVTASELKKREDTKVFSLLQGATAIRSHNA